METAKKKRLKKFSTCVEFFSLKMLMQYDELMELGGCAGGLTQLNNEVNF